MRFTWGLGELAFWICGLFTLGMFIFAGGTTGFFNWIFSFLACVIAWPVIWGGIALEFMKMWLGGA